ncbi:hypothetical protein SAMN04488540_1363 [Ferrimonas sediminum]|uniref:Uncharacterized protein n=1 Tax=Ferrimonas sediminum TaxID=718193 RepID=A0A1G9BUM6_9GAMM|nr:hypothetical protein SAMN04488540_1363 [Ferrimonas sediminum]
MHLMALNLSKILKYYQSLDQAVYRHEIVITVSGAWDTQ